MTLVENRLVLGLVGSPNREARTYRLVTAALAGAAREGARTELVQMADHVVNACKDCQPWVCNKNLKCTYEDPSFAYLADKVLHCDALVLGSPVYWWDTSGMVRYFFLKMFRIYARSAPLQGVPALGIAIAGGTGNGLVSGLRPLYHFFQVMQMRAIEPLPATRFNFDAALARAGELGARLATLAHERQPFATYEERLAWYDALPYLGLSRAEERKLLAALTATAVADRAPEVLHTLARADTLIGSGDQLAAQAEVTRAYDAAFKAFEAGQG